MRIRLFEAKVEYQRRFWLNNWEFDLLIQRKFYVELVIPFVSISF